MMRMMTPERLEAIRDDVRDVERRAGRIETWRAMPHRYAVESGLRTQGLRAPRLAAHLRDLIAEIERLQAERADLHIALDLSCEREARAHRAGQEAMRYRCASHVADNADGACNCGGTILCQPDCARVRLLDLVVAIRALEVE